MFLLNTNVVSELRKVRSCKADKNLARWADHVDASELYISVINLQELEIGVMLIERRDNPQGKVLRMWFENYVLPAFRGKILPVDTAVARRGAGLHVPNPSRVRDSLIAATALMHGMTVVTRNVLDFERTGVPIMNPWMKSSARR